ncbi:MAG TPA: cellulose binding domain-containing protein [Actinoplanes sp.]|nr:cellulose binding domain-containing protein [Actinoplanes sp.]
MVARMRMANVLMGLVVGMGVVVVASGPVAAAGAESDDLPVRAFQCSATAEITSQWGNGSVLRVHVKNEGTVPSARWLVSWSLGPGQHLVTGWNADVDVVDGAVVASNREWNGALAPGASKSFGVLLTGNPVLPWVACSSAREPSADHTITVTTSDNGRRVLADPGDLITVHVDESYKMESISGFGLELVSSTGGVTIGGPLVATYRVSAAGARATLTAAAYMPCPTREELCPIPREDWSVSVITAVRPPER